MFACPDFVVLGSDSGRIVILEYDPKNNSFNKLHQETFGKSGARRIVPGQYLAVDPKGRAVMIGAVEKAKLVYILNRDAAANLTISSPLEAHKNHAIIHHLVAVDVGFENPMKLSIIRIRPVPFPHLLGILLTGIVDAHLLRT